MFENILLFDLLENKYQTTIEYNRFVMQLANLIRLFSSRLYSHYNRYPYHFDLHLRK